jgi:hypothetical protein
MEASEKLAKRLIEADAIKDLLSEYQDLNTVIQSLVSTMDDPSSGLDKRVLLSQREALLNAANKVTDKADKETIITGFIQQIFASDNEKAAKVMERKLREFKHLDSQLVPPTFDLKASQPFKTIEGDDLSDRAKKRYSRFEGMLREPGTRGELVEFDEHTGARGQYLRLYKGYGEHARFATLIPLDVNSGSTTGVPYNIVRASKDSTAYRAPRYMMNAYKAREVRDANPNLVASIGNLKKHNVLRSVEDYTINAFFREVSQAGGFAKLNNRSWNERLREILEVEDKMAGPNTALGRHLTRQGRIASSAVTLHGLEFFGKNSNEMARDMLQWLAQSPDFDLGGTGPKGLAGTEIYGRKYFSVGVREGAGISAAGFDFLEKYKFGRDSPFAMDRFMEPVTARLDQVTNRINQGRIFVGQQTDIAGGAIKLGPAGVDSPANIGWSDQLTGGINKAILLDYGRRRDKTAEKSATGAIYKGLENSGQAYVTAADTTTQAFTIPVMDPKKHGLLSTELLNRVVEEQGGFITLTPKEMEQAFLGIGFDRSQFLQMSPGITSMRLKSLYSIGDDEKRTLHIGGEVDITRADSKLFGRMFKGTTDQLTEEKFFENLGGFYGMNRKELEGYDIKDARHLMVTSADAVKKSPYSMLRTMVTGYAITAKDKDYEKTITRHLDSVIADQNLKGLTRIAKKGVHAVGDINPVGAMAAATMSALKASGASATAAGRVLAGVWNRGVGGEGSWMTGQFEELGLDEGAFEAAVKQVWGNQADDVLKVADLGLGITVDTLMSGEGPTDWGASRGTMEPRVAELLQHRLLGMPGMSEDDANNIVASLFRRKVGGGDSLKTASELTTMLESLRGMRNLSETVSGRPEPTRMSLEDITKKLVLERHEDLGSLLKSYENGIILDLNLHSNPEKAAALKEAMGATGNAQGEFYLPGGEALDRIRGTSIKTTPGQPSKQIGSSLERLMTNFLSDLRAATAAQVPGQESLRKVFKDFSEKTTEMASQAIHDLSKARVYGGSHTMSVQYDVDQGTNLTPEQIAHVNETINKTKGMAVWDDHTAFLGKLKDFMGSGDQVDEAGKTIMNAHKETAAKLDIFFTGSEKGVGERRGIAQVSLRNPTLSRGNVALTQLFRDVREVGLKGGEDPVFSRIRETEWGQEALKRFEADIGSFSDIAKVSGEQNALARKKFFRDFASNLRDFVGGEGGGRTYFANSKFTIHHGDQLFERVDFGLSGQAGGDFDGDHWGHFLLDKRAGQKILSTLGKDGIDRYLEADALYKTKTHYYTQQAKKGLREYAKGQGYPMTVEDIEYMDALKERISKEGTGKVDVGLAEMKRAVLNMPGITEEEAAGPMALLKVAEEHTTIKGKGLPVASNMAEEISAAARHWAMTGESQPFEDVVKNSIFVNQDIYDKGIDIKAVDQNAPAWVSRGIEGRKIRVLDDLETLKMAMKHYITNYSRHALGSTSDALERAILKDPTNDAVRDLVMAGNSVQGGILSSARPMAEDLYATAGDAANKVIKAAGKMNKHGMAPIVVGAAASLLAMGLMKDPGYSPQPLIQEGEMNAPRVRDAMAAGSVFSYENSTGPMASDLQPKLDRYAMMDRPINTGTTYMNQPNTYQIGLQSDSALATAGAVNYISQMPGMSRTTSVRINDTRMPLTRNYFDRATGEY